MKKKLSKNKTKTAKKNKETQTPIVDDELLEGDPLNYASLVMWGALGDLDE